MQSLKTIKKDYQTLQTVEDVSQIFEHIASTEIRSIKDRVVASREFFHELWSMYIQLRVEVDSLPDDVSKKNKDRTAVVVITSDEVLGGSIDEELIEEVLETTNPPSSDYFVIGKRGARMLRAQDIEPVMVYPQPDIQKPIFVLPIIDRVGDYETVLVFFEQFESLSTQSVQAFELISGIRYIESKSNDSKDIALIFSSDYIFEPSQESVVNYLESMMRATALTELILESKLAQTASRFNTMSQAALRARKRKNTISTKLHRLQRQKRFASNYTYTKNIKSGKEQS